MMLLAGTATVLFNYSYMDPFFYENLGLASSADLTRGMWYTLYDSQGLSPAHSNLVGVDTKTGRSKRQRHVPRRIRRHASRAMAVMMLLWVVFRSSHTVVDAHRRLRLLCDV